ncbi:MAG: class I SAM-dependent methyltransferase [Planctomycetes bacterium]|nr:class I SAM-dependent methyltransferase [Planctomycetota bacterium]
MTVQRTAENWKPEEVRRLWGWISSREDMIGSYFSRSEGRSLQNLLLLTGQLRGRVLDFGCGPGFLLKRLCNFKGVEAEGLDFSPKNVEETKARLKDKPRFKGATVVDGLPSPLPESQFDLVTCIEVIEHLTDEQFQQTLAEILRLLKPGGQVLFTTPNDEKLLKNQNYCPFCDSQFHRWQHLRSFNSQQLKESLEQAGFEILFCQGIDLKRFKPPKQQKVLDMGVRYVAGKVGRGIRDASASLFDLLTGAKFPLNRRFRGRVTPGAHLIAFVRRPERGKS